MGIVAQKQSMRADILALIKSLTGKENLLTIPVEFVHYTGSLDAALFLSQLLYWSDKGMRTDGFIYKTYKEWKEEIHLGVYEVRKAVKVLKEKGILETSVKKANGNPTCHYRLDGDKFLDSFLEFLQERKSSKQTNDSLESEESLTEITTETKTEITSTPSASPDGERDGGNLDSIFDGEIVEGHADLARRLHDIVSFTESNKERGALKALAKEHSIQDTIACAEWMLANLDRVAVTPSSIKNWIPTFLAKVRTGNLVPRRYESVGEKSERIWKERNYEELFATDNVLYSTSMVSYQPARKNTYKTKSERLTEAWNDTSRDDLLLYD